jgi:hypothetical protein
MTPTGDAALAFQLILFIYMIVFLLLLKFYFEITASTHPNNAQKYLMATLYIYPLVAIIGIALTAAS